MKYLFLILSLIALNGACYSQTEEPRVKTGADLIIEKYFDIIKGKKIGLTTNHTGLLHDGTHLVDVLHKKNDVEIIALFGPEHGIRGDAPDGLSITHGADAKTGITVYSLYGKVNKPTKEMLKDVDILMFDIQDVGARFYTYISTLFYILQAGAENNIPVIILDRPNPINGVNVDGPILDMKYTSFVGIAPLPIMHGMTVGELAVYFNEEKLLGENLKADLTVIKVETWQRVQYFNDIFDNWVNPSPNIPNLNAAIVYPGVCLIEGTNVSEGRGTYEPFLTIGAPFIDSEKLIEELNSLNIKGASFNGIEYIPVEIQNMANSPKYENETCNGIKIFITDRNSFEPVKFGVKLIYALHKLFPEFKFNESRFNKLAGTNKLLEAIKNGIKPEDIFKSWESELSDFNKIRTKHLLY